MPTLPTLPLHFVAALLLVALSLAVRAMTANRLVRRKLRLTIVTALASMALAAALKFSLVPGPLAAPASDIENLLIALSVISAFFTLAINPLRQDRVPYRFPNILQDAFIAGTFMLVGTVLLGEKFLTTSAVGAVVVGFALQDTLGNAFAGLAIQIEKPFHQGHWIRVGELEGKVEEITWRATKLRTKAGTFVVVPNNVISRESIVNFSEPIVPTRIVVDVGADYGVPPNEVKRAIHEAIENASLALHEPPPDVVLMDFGSSAITYRARFWVEDYAKDEIARDQVRTGIYYSFRRHGIEIPWPIQIEYARQEPPRRTVDVTSRFAELLSGVEVFAALTDDERRELARESEERLFAAGEAIVREGKPGSSMFVIERGQVVVTVAPGVIPVAELGPGAFFGEMSLLTGNPRNATVRAVEDSVLMEITAAAFRQFVLGRQEIVDRVLPAVSKRQQQRDASLAAHAGTTTPEVPRSLLDRVRAFLQL